MSTLPPECEQLLISGYVLGNLSPAEAALFNEMLTENPSLNDQVVAVQQALDLAYAPVEIAPPPLLRDRILAAANTDTEKPVTLDKQHTVATSKSILPWNKIFSAIALAIITSLGIANYRLWQSVQTAKTINTQGERSTYLLTSQDPTTKSIAKLIVNRNQLKATLAVNNLPILPPEKAYALWTVVGKDAPYTTDEKGAILTAVFQVNKSGNFTQAITVPPPHLEPKTIQKMAITIEAVSTPQAHQGSIFISTGN
jgi:anti-sigma-K factor RskA